MYNFTIKTDSPDAEWYRNHELVAVLANLNEEQADTIKHSMWCMTISGNKGKFVLPDDGKSMWVELKSLPDENARRFMAGYVQGMVDLFNKGKTWAVVG